ncbi:ADP-ribosylglycohydrolase family protein [soil metagenome]
MTSTPSTRSGDVRCPVCGAPGIPIEYGMLSSELFEAAERGEVALGGCGVSNDNPAHECPCGHRWGAYGDFDDGNEMDLEDESVDRAVGAVLGVQAGDSLGATLEFMDAAAIAERHPGVLRDIVGGGPFNWPAGAPTDDTDLTWAVAQGYLDVAPAAATDAAAGPDGTAAVVRAVGERMLEWFDGDPRDIGGTTRSALSAVRRTGDPTTSGRTDDSSQANGSLMRTMAVAVARLNRPAERKADARAVSAITHAHPVCLDACEIYCDLAVALIRGASPDEAVSEALGASPSPEISAVVEQAWAASAVADLPGPHGGYVLWSLRLAVWALHQETSLEDTLVAVLDTGGDTDTNGAIAGGLLGAHHGAAAIPDRWRRMLQLADELERFARTVLTL